MVPTITGARRTNHPYAMNTKCANLEPMTDSTIAPTRSMVHTLNNLIYLSATNSSVMLSHRLWMVDKPTVPPNYDISWNAKGPMDPQLYLATLVAMRTYIKFETHK